MKSTWIVVDGNGETSAEGLTEEKARALAQENANRTRKPWNAYDTAGDDGITFDPQTPDQMVDAIADATAHQVANLRRAIADMRGEIERRHRGKIATDAHLVLAAERAVDLEMHLTGDCAAVTAIMREAADLIGGDFAAFVHEHYVGE